MKNYWAIILCVLLIFILVFTNRKNKTDYDDQLSAKNDSIEVLDNQNQILQIHLGRSQELFVDSENDILKYQDSLNAERTTIYRNRENYEAAIIDLISIPTDTLYREVSEWLDSR